MIGIQGGVGTQTVDQINDQRILFNGSNEDWKPFFEHCLNIYRIKEITGEENDPQYGWRWVWKRKGPDHWFMSALYARVGLDKFMESKAEVVGEDMFGDIPMGRIFGDEGISIL